MELRVSAEEPGLSLSACESDPDEKEISDDDDDDRNHKHRRREDARSQSLERDAVEEAFTKPYRRGSKPFENGHLYREAGSQSSETRKNFNFNPQEKDTSVKYDKRRPGFPQYSRGPSDFNQRIRTNQSFSGDPCPVRGRGRDAGLWIQHDSRFSSFDIASQIVQQGSVPPGMFAGRGFPTVSNAHRASWNAFGLVPGIPNGGLDMLNPLGLQGTFRPAISPPLNMGIGRQRCRDFEEQGFCLRGDMCPMEHGVNRIVVEDVQSLSQFNLPVSLPSGQLPGPPAVSGHLPATSGTTNTLLNSKGSHGNTMKRKAGDNGLRLNGTSIDSAASDFYDPDQPLWGNDSQTSNAFQLISQSNAEVKSVLDPGPSGENPVGLSEGCDNDRMVRSAGAALESQSTSSVWGRINSIKDKTEMRDKMVPDASPSNFIHNETKETQDPSESAQGVSHQVKQNNADSSLKVQSENGNMVRKPSQKAQFTLFVNGIPQVNNRRECLLSHFRKFGKVIDIYIPKTSERAFVQFSKREEAEAALRSPDAVMGNRFIKLWWANRDNVPDNGTISKPSVPMPPRGVAVSSVSPYKSVANKGKNDPQSTFCSGITAPVPASDHLKPAVANGPRSPPPLQKKLEVLKEELRKKQEMLDQKRNDFRLKLDKLEKQTTGLKGEALPEQVAKKQKLETVVNSPKAAKPISNSSDGILQSPRSEVAANKDRSKSVECVGPQNSRTAIGTLQESSSLKRSIRPLAPIGPSVTTNRFKLDNRPTAFRIIPPLPNDLADVPVLKEHFSPYGDLTNVELDDIKPIDINANSEKSKTSARIYFSTRYAAEKAFSSGKCWKGHNLQFVWLKSINSSKDLVDGESHVSSSKGDSDASIQPVAEISKTTSEKSTISGDENCEKMEKTVIEHADPDESNYSS